MIENGVSTCMDGPHTSHTTRDGSGEGDEAKNREYWPDIGRGMPFFMFLNEKFYVKLFLQQENCLRGSPPVWMDPILHPQLAMGLEKGLKTETVSKGCFQPEKSNFY